MMNIKTLSIFSLINAVIFVAVFSLLGNKGVSQEFLNQLRDSADKIQELNAKIDRISASLGRYGEGEQAYIADQQPRLMAYPDVRAALADVLADTLANTQKSTGHVPSDSNDEATGQIELSSSQQKTYENLSQQLDGYGGGLSFHKLISEMEQQKLPDTKRNELLSRLVQKLNNNEITSEEVLGTDR